MDTTPLLEQIKNAYQQDEECKQILFDHQQQQNHSDFKVTNTGFIQRHQQMLIPNSEQLRTLIISSHHDDLTAAHRGTAKTFDLISRNFYWKNMHHDIKLYVKTCHQCQQNFKSSAQRIIASNPNTRYQTAHSHHGLYYILT
jgi:hypothetical protein